MKYIEEIQQFSVDEMVEWLCLNLQGCHNCGLRENGCKKALRKKLLKEAVPSPGSDFKARKDEKSE